MRRYLWAVAAVVVGVGAVVGVLVWSRSGEATSRDSLTEAYASGLAGTNLSDNDARCLAEATVGTIGSATLAEATSPDGIRANPPVAPSELGIAVSGTQGEAYYDALSECMDPRPRVTEPMGDAEARCFNQKIDDVLLRELVVARFRSAAEISPELDAALTDVAEHCPEEPAGGQPQPQIAPLARFRNVPAGGPSATVTVISYNVRGLLRAADRSLLVDTVDPDMTRFTELTGDEVARRRADFVLLQEVCGSQAELIAQRSTARGHPMSLITVNDFGPQPARPSTPGGGSVTGPLPRPTRYDDAVRLCPGDNPGGGTPVPYGRAILANLPNATRIDPPPGYPAQCIRAESPRPMRVCNVHAKEGDTRLSHAFQQWARSEPLILGGDFNTIDAVEPMPSLADFMWEAASGRPGGAAPPTSPAGPAISYKKIDYIFADMSHFDRPLSSDVLPMRCHLWKYCSDHQMVIGEFPLVVAGFPPQFDVSSAGEITQHGNNLSAVYLAVTDSFDDPRITEAEAAARGVGYDTAASDLGCDAGAAKALGRDPASFAAAVAVYFGSEDAAAQARAAFERLGIPVVGVANVTLVCLDEGA